MVAAANEAAEKLSARGIDAGVVNAMFAKPLDRELLRQSARRSRRLLTIEEHLGMGGFGSAVLEALHEEGLDGVKARVHAIPDQFVEHGPAAYQRSSLGLDADGVVEKVFAAFPDLAEKAGAEPDSGSRDRIQSAEGVRW